METSELEKRIAKKYARITNTQPVGLVDMIRILTGPDMIELMSEYISSKKDPGGSKK